MLNKEEERQILNQGHLTGPHISQRQMRPLPLTKPHQLSLPLFPSASSIISSKEPNQVFVNTHSPRIPKTSSYRDNNQPASVCISGKSLSGLKHRASLGGEVLLWFYMPAVLPHHETNPRGCQTTAALFGMHIVNCSTEVQLAVEIPQFVHKQCN